MSRHSRGTKLLVLYFLSLLVVVVAVNPASAYIEEKHPITMNLAVGTSNSTNLDNLASDNNYTIEFGSNRSGDRNFYESCSIESKTDFEDYFHIRYAYSSLPVSVIDEKISNDGDVHKKVIRIQDRRSSIYNNVSSSYNHWSWMDEPINESSVEDHGFIEFYFLSEALNGTFMTYFGDNDKRKAPSEYYIALDAPGIYFGIRKASGEDNSSFFVTTDWDENFIRINATDYVPNTWYHVRLSFNYNVSWSVAINNNTVYNSSNWTINGDLDEFNTFAMMTQTKIDYSAHVTHVFYVDAIGFSYNMTNHNQDSTMQFNADYEDYVDEYSINNLNDHDLNASLAIYFKFNLESFPDKTRSFNLFIKGYATHAIDTGLLKLFNHEYRVYDTYDSSYKPISPGFIEEYEFSSDENDTIDTNTYISDTNTFLLKIELSSDNNFEFRVTYIIVKFNIGETSGLLIAVIFVCAIAIGAFMIKITSKGSAKATTSRGRRRGRSARSID
ncbi:MAG: hypothetical protein ACTSUE_11035 [Promethearchaeota archaeon]